MLGGCLGGSAAPASPVPQHCLEAECSPEASLPLRPPHPEVLLPDLPTREGAQHLPENRSPQFPLPERARAQCPLGPISPIGGQLVSVLRTTYQLRSWL